jgi:hypothetical protein
LIRLRDVAVSGLLAGATGLAWWGLWWSAGYPAGVFVRGLAGHGPDPLAWPRLLTLWLPLGHVLFAVAYWALGRWCAQPLLRRHFLADQLTLGLVLPLATILLVLRGGGPWRSVVGGGYVLFVAIKTGVLVHALWRWRASQPNRSPLVARALFLGAFLPYLLLDGYVATAISTSGDEPYYLLVTHSLLYDHDFDLANNFARRDYLPFYWDTLSTTSNLQMTADGHIYSLAHVGLEPLLLLPGYAVAGRLGAMVTVSLLSAVTLAMAFALARHVGASPRAAFLAWLAGAFNVPVLSLVGSPWPEMPGAFLAVLGAAALLRDRQRGSDHAIVALCCASLFVLKNRFVLLVGALMLGLIRRVTWKAVTALAAASGLLVLAVIWYDRVVSGGLFLGQTHAGGLAGQAYWAGRMIGRPLLRVRGLLGFLLDQEHGILLAAPVLSLALVGGVVAAIERRWRLLALAGAPFVATWYFLGGTSIGTLPLWFGGFDPPARYLVATVPLLLLLLALALDRTGGRLGWSVTVALYVLTFAYALVLAVWPALRFQAALGRAAILAEFWKRVGLDPGRLLPAYVPPGGEWIGPGVAGLLLILLGGVLLARRAGGPPTGQDVAVGIAAAALLVALPLGYIWWHPWGTYPAAVWESRAGTSFRGVIPVDLGDGPVPLERLVWAVRRDGWVDLAPRLPKGRYQLVVRAGAQGPGPGPLLTLQVAGLSYRPVALVALPSPAWRERDYTYEVDWHGGRLPVRIELSGVSGRAPVSLAYLNHLEIAYVNR